MVDVATAGQYMLALSEGGRVYSWGKNTANTCEVRRGGCEGVRGGYVGVIQYTHINCHLIFVCVVVFVVVVVVVTFPPPPPPPPPPPAWLRGKLWSGSSKVH